MQRSEDPARNLRAVWLGPTGAWRWPTDATYTEWAVGLAVHLLTIAALWLVLPFGVLIIAGATLTAGWLTRRIDRRLLARWTFTDPGNARRRARRFLTGIMVILGLLLFPHPMSWLLPLSWWAATIGALITAVTFVRVARPWIDGNRPVTYWINTLWGIGRGPRARRKPVTVGFTGGPHMLTQPLNDEVMEFLAAVAAVTEEEIQVGFYRRKMPVVEAMTFGPGTHEQVVHWLRRHGLPVRVLDIRQRTIRGTAGGTYSVTESARLSIGDLVIENGMMVEIEAGSAEGAITAVRAWDPQEFARQHEEVS